MLKTRSEYIRVPAITALTFQGQEAGDKKISKSEGGREKKRGSVVCQTVLSAPETGRGCVGSGGHCVSQWARAGPQMETEGSGGGEPHGNLNKGGRNGKCKGPEAAAESKGYWGCRMGWDMR